MYAVSTGVRLCLIFITNMLFIIGNKVIDNFKRRELYPERGISLIKDIDSSLILISIIFAAVMTLVAYRFFLRSYSNKELEKLSEREQDNHRIRLNLKISGLGAILFTMYFGILALPFAIIVFICIFILNSFNMFLINPKRKLWKRKGLGVGVAGIIIWWAFRSLIWGPVLIPDF